MTSHYLVKLNEDDYNDLVFHLRNNPDYGYLLEAMNDAQLIEESD